MPDAQSLYNRIVDAAEAHGDNSEADHEVGDLQDALRAAINLLTPDQLKAYEDILNTKVFDELPEWIGDSE